jgi:tetratricopeptide (TPR) repeat protein
MTTHAEAPTVFISYSHKDEDWKNLLVTHLGVLRDQRILNIWQDRLIEAGADWHANIREAMEAASIAVILVTANSLTSEYILNDEVPPLLERRRDEGVRIFPVVAEPCAWQAVEWLRRMNLRPAEGRPLSSGDENQLNADLAALTNEIYLLLRAAAATAIPEQKFVQLNPDDISIGRLPVTGRELFGRELELDMLDGAWADENTNVLTLVAWGGVGKSALVNHWLRRRMLPDNFRGAERVYAWSFYRQGTSEQGVSADQFIDAALRWFGDPDPTAGTPWDKGERLARLVRKQRTLLLLDGLEPLQFPPGREHQEGALKEHSMQALLRELAIHNPGLCVITSRLAVADLLDSEGSTARRISLEHLSPRAGAEVLRDQGVLGQQSELELASAEFGGHALALTLLGSYLKNVHDGDIARRDRMDILREDEERAFNAQRSGHAQRVMASYESWFGEGPELNVLRMIALFDRPADGPAIAALRAAPAIANLTDRLQGFDEEDWRRTLNRLRAAKLIADRDANHPDTLDAHPLVREYFKRQLKRNHPDAWREGNSRLYEHLRDTTKEFPDTIEEMSPLYAAVTHGCAAGRYQEALDELYWTRIRGETKMVSVKMLGMVGAELAALSSFFDTPWQPSPTLSDDAKAFLLNEVGLTLRATGQLVEAARTMEAGLCLWVLHEELINAAISCGNLSDIYLTIGDLSRAWKYAQESVEWADLSGDSNHRMSKRTGLGYVLYHMGRLSESEAVMLDAEKIHKERQHEFPLLFSLSGIRYCTLLLHQGKYQEAQSRATQLLEYSKQYGWLLDIALSQLSLGRAYLLQARHKNADEALLATDYLDQAVDGIRRASQLDELPRGLLARAHLRRIKYEFQMAQADLNVAMSIASRGGMGLHQMDCHLEYARLYLAEEPRDLGKAREHLGKAREMIERMGYHLRDEAVREIEAELEAAGG